jgi:hypothetical protein
LVAKRVVSKLNRVEACLGARLFDEQTNANGIANDGFAVPYRGNDVCGSAAARCVALHIAVTPLAKLLSERIFFTPSFEGLWRLHRSMSATLEPFRHPSVATSDERTHPHVSTDS